MELIFEPAYATWLTMEPLPDRTTGSAEMLNVESDFHCDTLKELAMKSRPLRSISYSFTQFMYCGLPRISSAVNLPASLGPKDPAAAARPGSIVSRARLRL